MILILIFLNMRKNLIIFVIILSEIFLIGGQKCNIYDINLHKITNELAICEKINLNKNTYCDTKIGNCICQTNHYGENCEKNIEDVNVIPIGITNGSFVFIVLFLLIFFPLVFIVGFFIIAFIFRNQEINYPAKKKVNISKNNKEDDKAIELNKQNFGIIKNNLNNENINISDNSNNLYNKKITYNENNNKINNENEISDNNKYSQVPLSTITDRKDENMLITLRNNTENDIDLSKSKVREMNDLNRDALFEEKKDKFYGEKILEIEEFTSEFKSSLQETFSENENFMIYTDKIFTGLENEFSKKQNQRKFIFNKSKSELQKIFNKIISDIPNGKNYIKSNNFFLKFQKIFETKDEENIDEEENIQFRNSDGEISFSKDNSEVNINSKKILDPNKIVLNVNEKSENLDNSGKEEISDLEESNNNINKIKNRVLKKAFMIKSVEVSRNNAKNYNDNDREKKKESVDIKKNISKKRLGSNVSNLSYK